MHFVRISIADIVFEILSPSKRFIIWLEENYKPFFSKKNAEFKLFLKFDKKKGNNISSSSISKWSGTQFYAETDFFDVDMDYSRGEITASFNSGSGIVDLLKLLCGVILAKKGGFLLHSCGVIEKEFSYIFFGPSGSGKTTIAGLSGGRTILSDETTAVIPKNGFYYAYATPFFGEFGQVKNNTGAPVKAFFNIKKDTCFKLFPVKPVSAAKEMLCHTVLNILDCQTTGHLLNTLDSLVKKIPSYELHFKKEPEIWEYINGFVR
ncbi:MAG: hypothetical protein AB1498_11645 [bacterium]